MSSQAGLGKLPPVNQRKSTIPDITSISNSTYQDDGLIGLLQ